MVEPWHFTCTSMLTPLNAYRDLYLGVRVPRTRMEPALRDAAFMVVMPSCTVIEPELLDWSLRVLPSDQ